MNMFKMGNTCVNLADVIATACPTADDKAHPYGLRVYLRNGKEFQCNYVSQKARDDAAMELYRLMCETFAAPVSRYEVENIVQRTADTIRR